MTVSAPTVISPDWRSTLKNGASTSKIRYRSASPSTSTALTARPTAEPGRAPSATERAAVADGNFGWSLTADTVTITTASSDFDPSDAV